MGRRRRELADGREASAPGIKGIDGRGRAAIGLGSPRDDQLAARRGDRGVAQGDWQLPDDAGGFSGGPRDDRTQPGRTGVPTNDVCRRADQGGRLVGAGRGQMTSRGNAARGGVDAPDLIVLRRAVATTEKVDRAANRDGRGVVDGKRQRAQHGLSPTVHFDDVGARRVALRQTGDQQRATATKIGTCCVLHRRVELANLVRRKPIRRHAGSRLWLGRGGCAGCDSTGSIHTAHVIGHRRRRTSSLCRRRWRAGVSERQARGDTDDNERRRADAGGDDQTIAASLSLARCAAPCSNIILRFHPRILGATVVRTVPMRLGALRLLSGSSGAEVEATRRIVKRSNAHGDICRR